MIPARMPPSTWVAAVAYDRIVGAIGPFEMTEYLGLALTYGSLAITFRSSRPHEGTGRSVEASA